MISKFLPKKSKLINVAKCGISGPDCVEEDTKHVVQLGQALPGQVLGQAFLYCIPMYTTFRSLGTRTNLFLFKKLLKQTQVPLTIAILICYGYILQPFLLSSWVLNVQPASAPLPPIGKFPIVFMPPKIVAPSSRAEGSNGYYLIFHGFYR